jgi:hypothetical protein
MAITNVIGDRFDSTEPITTKCSIRDLKIRKTMLKLRNDQMADQIIKNKLEIDSLQALIDAAKLAGAVETGG